MSERGRGVEGMGRFAKAADKVFAVRSKRNGVTRVVRERYVRQDWECRTEGCERCAGQATADAGDLWGAFPSLARRVSGARLILVPDFGVLCEHTQLFTAYPALFDNVVVSGSAITRLQDIGYTRTLEEIRTLTADTRRSVVVFSDHACEDLAGEVQRLSGGATPGAARDLAVVLGNFYADHLGLGPDVSVVVLSNEAASEDRPAVTPDAPVVEVLTTAEYLRALQAGSRLSHMLRSGDAALVDKAALLNESLDELLARKREQEAARAAGEGEGGSESLMFEPHASEAVVEAGLKSGVLVAGVLAVSRRNRRAAFVTSRTGERIYISSLKARNRAIQDDEVAVRILPRSLWEVPPQSMSRGRGGGSEGSGASEGGDSGTGSEDAVMTGSVVAVMRRTLSGPMIATLPALNDGALVPNSVLAVPMDIRLPKIRVSSSRLASLFGQRLLVSLDEWRASSAYPSGHVVRALGAVGDAAVEMEALLLANTIVVEPFSPAALAELPDHEIGAAWEVPAAEVAARRDVRGLHRVASIDPPGSKDVDDALSVCEVTSGKHAGCVEFGVHIADVSHFVAAGSVLDAEARQRGTTVYLADRRYDMLPAVLSEDLCSLRGGVDRLAVSAIFTVDVSKGFSVRDVWFGRTVINSSYQLEYGQAQALFDEGVGSAKVARFAPFAGVSQDDLAQLRRDIGLLVGFGRALKEKRRARGALELHSDEMRVQFSEGTAGSAVATSSVVGLSAKVQLEMMDIVAEFMILANEAVAERVYVAYPEAALLRRHPLPRNEAFEDLVRVATLRGYALDTSSNAGLAASLSAAMVGDGETLQLLRQLATAAMSEAVYFSTGSVAEDEFYHYGLAAAYYTHFTSPIRRYADVMVHRELLAAVGDGPVVPSLANRGVELLAAHLNDRNRVAKAAQRDSVDLFRNLYFKLHGPVEASGVAYSFFDNGFEVYVAEYGLRAPVYVSATELAGGEHPWFAQFESSGSGYAVELDAGSLRVVARGGSDAELARIELFDRVRVSISGSDALARVGGIAVSLVGADAGDRAGGASERGQQADFRELLNADRRVARVGGSGYAELGSGARRAAAATRMKQQCYELTGTDGRSARKSWYVRFAGSSRAAAAGGGSGSDGGEGAGDDAQFAARTEAGVWERGPGRRRYSGRDQR
ncbi:exosome complex exonuclease RRP44 [Thecamonas trahens ATCC 50062]|uniref:DIS3-like exonuclease 1 n=1 Tax=Thecamonas trahens ATCC 50062 TaxID=461836 RepID=A0A0L0DJD3_THETB|nr:exosome complex exonuclease RRP44 [Thecamonas trahens ATCC 50062]KNC52176.1 exosome complex exonuclease RRP44 [Thecamonas trahens ATCC 50062]|eukprot:XP_013762179.1 exosome complex exonuclease RRP44 [Thecamonas trahens ATCC 50062]